MKCDECDKELGPNRAIRISTCARKREVNAWVFCARCHRKVFTAADARKYPDLFRREAE